MSEMDDLVKAFSDISVLFIGFDGYIDVWNHCFELLNKNWPNRPKTYLACSELKPSYDNVEIINAGKNSEWSKKVQVALDQIDTKYVLLMLEDFFVSEPVDNKKIVEALELVRSDDIKFYQILVQLIHQDRIKGKPYKGDRHIHVVPKDKKYPLNLQAAIWNREFLKERVGTENYNAWMFEINQLDVNMTRGPQIEFLIDDRNICNITHTVVQSKYLPGAIKQLKTKGYNIDRTERNVLTPKDNFKYLLKLYMYEITPQWLVKPAKQIGKLMKVDFVTDRIAEGSSEKK